MTTRSNTPDDKKVAMTESDFLRRARSVTYTLFEKQQQQQQQQQQHYHQVMVTKMVMNY
jgi:hypothetical protein